MADIFDKKKIIATLRAQGVPDKDIEKLYGPIPKPTINSAKVEAHKQANAWKYDNKHKRPVRAEDADPNYEPVEELRKKTRPKSKPRITKKKPKKKPKPVKNDWNTASENRLKALYEAGYSTEEMATEFKTTKDAITGKLSRLRKAGWKGTIGTTHNPLPSSGGNTSEAAKAANRKLSPSMKKFLAGALETNFGAVGRFFSKKWGLIDDKKYGAGKGGTSSDVTESVIKSNEMVMSALSKLDTSLKRGTNTLTKSIATATSKMTDAVNNVVELVKKNSVTGGGPGGSSASKIGGGSAGGAAGGIGMIAALLGGVAMSSLFSSRAEASVDPNDQINTSEDALREEGAPKENELAPSDIEYKVKELTFDADDITFEYNELKFTDKKGQSSGGPTGGAAGGAAGGGGAGGSVSGGGGAGDAGGGLTGQENTGAGASGFGADGVGGAAAGPTDTGGGGGGGGKGGGHSGGPTTTPTDPNAPADFNSRFSGDGGKVGGDGTGMGGALAEERAEVMKHLDANPELKDKLFAIAANEQGTHPQGIQGVMEETINRSIVRGGGVEGGIKRLEKELRFTSEGGYYDDSRGSQGRAWNTSKNNRKAFEEAYEKVRAGGNVSNNAYGNASGDTAQNKITGAGGLTAQPTKSINGETFFGPNSDEPKYIKEYNDRNERLNARAKEIEAAAAASKSNALTPEALKKSAVGSTNDAAEAIKKGGPVSDGGFNDIDAAALKTPTGGDNHGGNSQMLPPVIVDSPSNDSGAKLNGAQKEKDDADTAAPASPSSGNSDGGKRSDISNQGSTQVALLETEGPNHFADYPMSDQGVGA